MADSAPKTQNWKAWQDLQPGPGSPKLLVTGRVEVTNTNQAARLKERVPQGINPRILMLDLTITSSGPGNTVTTWKDARFETGIEKNQYSNVDILWEGKNIAHIDVKTVQ